MVLVVLVDATSTEDCLQVEQAIVQSCQTSPGSETSCTTAVMFAVMVGNASHLVQAECVGPRMGCNTRRSVWLFVQFNPREYILIKPPYTFDQWCWWWWCWWVENFSYGHPDGSLSLLQIVHFRSSTPALAPLVKIYVVV